jgi:tRNA pseudouridine38-40 synthase
MRYFAIISYNGSRYFGWQKQSKSNNTVQSQIERILNTYLRKYIETMGCGRTDTGVHAKEFYLHFDFDEDINLDELRYKFNVMLPSDIVVHRVIKVKDDLHARFDAISRSYVYRIKTARDPFDPIYYHYRQGEMNLDKLNLIANEILHYDNFEKYCKSNTNANTTNICNIEKSVWIVTDENTYEYHITANRFLRGMIRLLVGMMLNFQKDKFSFEDIINSLSRQKSLPIIWSVPPDGLILQNIKYNYNFDLF